MEKVEKNKCVYCGDPNCDLSCKPISDINTFLFFFVAIIFLTSAIYFCFS